MSTIQQQYDRLATKLESLRKFAETYGDKIPEGLGGIALYSEPEFAISLQFQSDDNRLRALQAAGDIFGRDGWTATPTYDGRAFDWKKVVDGVVIAIYGAESLPKLEPMPVPPTKFPLQLTDAA